MKQHFISRNMSDIAQIFSTFNDLQKVHPNFVIYYDGRTWELFDVLLAVTPIRHNSRHVLDFIRDMRTLFNDIINVSMIGMQNKQFHKQSQTASLRHLKEQYPESWSYFLPKNYQHGKIY